MSLASKVFKVAPLLTKSVQIQSVRNLQAIPCRDPVRGPKYVLMSGSLFVMWLSFPIYVLLNLKYYNGQAVRE